MRPRADAVLPGAVPTSRPAHCGPGPAPGRSSGAALAWPLLSARHAILRRWRALSRQGSPKGLRASPLRRPHGRRSGCMKHLHQLSPGRRRPWRPCCSASCATPRRHRRQAGRLCWWWTACPCARSPGYRDQLAPDGLALSGAGGLVCRCAPRPCVHRHGGRPRDHARRCVPALRTGIIGNDWRDPSPAKWSNCTGDTRPPTSATKPARWTAPAPKTCGSKRG